MHRGALSGRASRRARVPARGRAWAGAREGGRVSPDRRMGFNPRPCRSSAATARPSSSWGVIWFLSAQPDLRSGLDSDWDLLLRKLAHMTVFGALLALWWRAAGPRTAVVMTLAYAAVDEWHQTWVDGRNGAFSDWAIDALGAGIAAA